MRNRMIGAGLVATLGVAVAVAEAQTAKSAHLHVRTERSRLPGGATRVNGRCDAEGPAHARDQVDGYANFELVYNGQVLLLDAAFDRGSIFPPLGFTVPDVTRANAILIGHGHGDHMSDAAAVANRTKAIVVGAPLTAEKLLTQSVPPAQVRRVTGRGGEVVELPGDQD